MKFEEEDLLKKEKVRKSLKYSIMDGSFYSAMVGFGESFFSAFAVFLQANNFILGLLGSLPQTLGSLSQLLSTKLMGLFKSRKKMVCTFALLQGIMYIPIALLFFFGEMKAIYLVIFVCLYFIFGMILGPAWNSWMGDLVDKEERGAYFGRRNKITGFASFITFIIAGYLLQLFSGGTTIEYVGFFLLFGIAFASRVASFIYLTKKYEPRFEINHESRFSFIDFVKDSFSRSFNRFVLYLSLMNLSVYVAAPFFTVYMLKDLHFNYAAFTIITATSILVKFLMMPVWGKITDKHGTRKVLTITGILMPFSPLLWLFSNDFLYLIMAQVYSGFVWAGFEIASFNYIFDATTPQKRPTCVAYFNVLNGIMIFIGAMLGTLLVKYNNLFWSVYLLVFLVSFILRITVSTLFLPFLKEFRRVENISYKDLMLKVISGMPTMGLMHDIITFKHNHDEKNATNNNTKGSGKNTRTK
jgi:MFS family permease